MRLSAADQKTYPNFTYYLQHNMPSISTLPSIVKSINKYGNLSLSEFKTAITWGSGPTVTVTDLHSGQCGVPKAYGCFRHAKPGAIEIHTQVVKDFEASHSTTSTDTTSRGQSVYVAGATLLHELCHWGNYNNVPRIPELKEMGAAFELATYGKVIY